MSDRLEEIERKPLNNIRTSDVIYLIGLVNELKNEIEGYKRSYDEVDDKNLKLEDRVDELKGLLERQKTVKYRCFKQKQRYRKTTEKIRDVMECLNIDMINKEYALRVINDLLMEHYSLEREANEN